MNVIKQWSMVRFKRLANRHGQMIISEMNITTHIDLKLERIEKQH